VSPHTSAALGHPTAPPTVAPCGKHAKQILFLPVPLAAAPLHFKAGSKLVI
jgi:hypothetical protein